VPTPLECTYEIHEVAELTGLSPARLRAWERRHEIIRPRRLPNGHRAYTADQVALLRAYARLTDAGERIGGLAQEPTAEVLSGAEHRVLDGTPVAALVDAVKSFDRERLEALVAQQIALRGLQAFAQDIVGPLAVAVGDLWRSARSRSQRSTWRARWSCTRGCSARSRWCRSRAGAFIYLAPDLPVEEVLEAAWRPRLPGFLPYRSKLTGSA
jgi:DNA-binding transcriptional MerR regulator